jgi:lipid II:glycine glycyltransferase (peptidoglycan interpeptide bridge formation enzyme)
MICRKAEVKDEEQWNNVVKESTNGTFYHTWEWKEVIEKGLNSEAFPVIVEDENKLVGVFPFFIRNAFEDSKINIYLPSISNKYQIGCSPHQKIYSFGGPCVLSSIEDSEKIYNLMFDFIEKYTKKKKSIIDHWIHPYHNSLDSVLIQNGYYRKRNKKTAIINIDKDLDEICRGFKKQYRRDIKHSIRSGVIISESNGDISDIDLYYNKFQKVLIDRIVERTNNNYGMVYNAAVPYAYFKAIYEILFPKKLAKLFFAEYKGKKIAALINFYYKDTIYIGNISGVYGEYGTLNANRLLIWRTIVDGKENGFRRYDLSGLTPDTESGEYFFKTGFNGEILETGQYKKTFRLKRIKQLNKIINKLTNIKTA